VSANGKGFFFPVTLLDNPPEDASFVAHEIFGPIRSVFKYKTDELQQVARQIEAGTVPRRGRPDPLRRAWVIGINGTENSLKRLRQPKFHANFGRIFERLKFRPASAPRRNSLRCCGTGP
jgi:Aldehyde dehydrogenase family